MEQPTPIDPMNLILELMAQSQRILFITGAGLSADSGLPTYRGIGGLYEEMLTEENLPIEEALSGPMFQHRPELTWKYIGQIEASCRGAGFNDGHRVIAEMEQHFEEVWVLTQNVDGFHTDAGSTRIIEIHGNLRHLKCMNCGDAFEVKDFSEIDIPPRCTVCSGMVRPDVVLFGEFLPQMAINTLMAQLSRGFDLIFSVGTSSLFPYIAAPILDAFRREIPTVEINPGESQVSHLVTHRLKARAAKTLTALWRAYRDQLA